MHVLGTRVPRRLGVAGSASSTKAAQALGCSLTPGLRISFGRVSCMARAASLPGLWTLGSYCCVVLVFGSGLRLGVHFGNPASPGWGLGRVCLGTVCGVVPLLPAGVCGVRGWAWVSACTPPFVVGDMGRAWLRAPRLHPAVSGSGVRCGRACWGLGFGCAPPLLRGVLGCVCACAPVPRGLLHLLVGGAVRGCVLVLVRFSPSRSPGPLHPAAELLQRGGRPPGEVGGGLGGGGVQARGPGAAGGGRGPAVLAGVALPGGARAAVAGAGDGGRVRAEGGTGGGGGHGAAVACLAAPGGAGVVVVGAGAGGWVWAAGGTGSLVGSVGGGGGGPGAAVACLAAPGGVGAVVAGAGGGGRVRAEGGARSPVGPVGGGGGGHGAAVARVVAPGGAGAAGAGPLGGRGGALGSGSSASGWLRRGSSVATVGAGGERAVRGGSGSAASCGTRPHRPSRASQEVSAGPGGPRVVPPGTGGGGVPRPPWICHVGV